MAGTMLCGEVCYLPHAKEGPVQRDVNVIVFQDWSSLDASPRTGIIGQGLKRD